MHRVEALPRGKLKILIADDDEGDRTLVRRALAGMDQSFECVEAASVAEALAACEKIAFDCAIIDYRIPGEDGLQGVSALRLRMPYMCIIMATGHGDENIATEAMKRGASDYIVKKSISATAIGRVIKSAMENETLRHNLAEQREALENFASVLVHDLKTPTRSMRQFVQLIEEFNQKGEPEKAAKYLHHLTEAVQRIDGLIDALRRYTKAGESAAFTAVDMSMVMAGAMANLGHQIGQRGAQVTHGDLPVVAGDNPQLTQLLQNLIGNAIKYCQADAPKVQVLARRNAENLWLFAVKDNGIGIPERDYRRVFEPFLRLHSVGEYEGTGLGLAICKKIVERHHGAIWCESTGGRRYDVPVYAAGRGHAGLACPTLPVPPRAM